jgi:hypothetical protein
MPRIDERTRPGLTSEEWAHRTQYARRRARFTQLVARAERDVAKDLPLTAEEWAALAAVYLRAAGEAAAQAA